MGAWDEGPFDNDTAADYATGLQIVEAALTAAAEAEDEDYLDADVGQMRARRPRSLPLLLARSWNDHPTTRRPWTRSIERDRPAVPP
jgi:hypothetical protein